jgi:hypothetical protein
MVVSTTVVSTRIFLPSTAAVLLRQLDKSWMQMRNHLTLEKHRTYGTGPRYSKIGGRVVYRLEDLQAWVSGDERASTSDDTGDTILPAKRHAAVSPAYADWHSLTRSDASRAVAKLRSEVHDVSICD